MVCPVSRKGIPPSGRNDRVAGPRRGEPSVPFSPKWLFIFLALGEKARIALATWLLTHINSQHAL